MPRFTFYDLQNKNSGADPAVIFREWKSNAENIAFFSPHDDDAMLGAGYLMRACLDAGAAAHLYIFCDGRAGYSTPEEKDGIVARRKSETIAAYRKIGLDGGSIVWFDLPDFSAGSRVGWVLAGGGSGTFALTIPSLRAFGATRLIIPNHYREHSDHTAVGTLGCSDAPQAGAPVLAEWGNPTQIKTVLQYAVWGDFSPEDALIRGSGNIRATHAIRAASDIEEVVESALREYKSQSAIIDDLIRQRDQRRRNGDFIELYMEVDPRPALDYAPYWELIDGIAGKRE